jgi:hypothetical protein
MAQSEEEIKREQDKINKLANSLEAISNQLRSGRYRGGYGNFLSHCVEQDILLALSKFSDKTEFSVPK